MNNNNNTDQPNNELTRRSFITRVAKIAAIAPLIHFTFFSAYRSAHAANTPTCIAMQMIDNDYNGCWTMPVQQYSPCNNQENCFSLQTTDIPCLPSTTGEDTPPPPPPPCTFSDPGSGPGGDGGE